MEAADHSVTWLKGKFQARSLAHASFQNQSWRMYSRSNGWKMYCRSCQDTWSKVPCHRNKRVNQLWSQKAVPLWTHWCCDWRFGGCCCFSSNLDPSCNKCQQSVHVQYVVELKNVGKQLRCCCCGLWCGVSNLHHGQQSWGSQQAGSPTTRTARGGLLKRMQDRISRLRQRFDSIASAVLTWKILEGSIAKRAPCSQPRTVIGSENLGRGVTNHKVAAEFSAGLCFLGREHRRDRSGENREAAPAQAPAQTPAPAPAAQAVAPAPAARQPQSSAVLIFFLSKYFAAQNNSCHSFFEACHRPHGPKPKSPG